VFAGRVTWLLSDVSPPRAPPPSPNSAHAVDGGGAVDALLGAAPGRGLHLSTNQLNLSHD